MAKGAKAETEAVEKDYTGYPEKEETKFQARFADWLLGDEVGVDPSTLKSKMDAFRMGVKLGTSLRIQYQQSEDNQNARAAEREEREGAKAESKKAAKKTSKKAAAEADEDEEEEAEAPAPAKKAAKKATKKAAKKATKKAAPVDEDDEADDF